MTDTGGPTGGTAPPDPLSRERTASAVRSGASRLGFHAVAAVVLTFPMAWRLTERLPTGTEPTGTVALFNLWTLRWGADHLLPFGTSYWNAPIFAPSTGTFAWSEPQPLTSAVFALLRHVGGDVAGYDLVVLLAIALNGVAAAFLARRLGAPAVVAALAGLLAQTLPFVTSQLGVLQLIMLWPVWWFLGGLVGWARSPTLRDAVHMGLAMSALALTCGNHLILVGLSAVLAGGLLIERSWWNQRAERLGGVAVAAGIVALLAMPILLAQQDRLDGFTRAESTVLAGSMTWNEWTPSGRSWPGITLLILALVGGWVGRARREVRFLLALAAAGVVVSMGSRLSLAGWHPWTTAAHVVPSLDRLRSPWRAAAVTQVALVGLTVPALSAGWAARRILARSIVAGSVAVAVVLAWPGSGGWIAYRASTPEWASALTDRQDRAVVASVPFAPGRSAEEFEHTVVVMLQGLDDGHPLLNGYSGFFPADHGLLRERLAGFPDQRSIETLLGHDVRYVVADPAWLATRDRALGDFGITVLVDDRDGLLLELEWTR